MTGKNMQNVEKPTKATRQYKHTPRPSKRLTSKIFALVACLLLLVTFTIPTFAHGYNSANPPVVTMHPYAPDSISFVQSNNSTYNFSVADTFPLGSNLDQNSYSSLLTTSSGVKSVAGVTSINTTQKRLTTTINTSTTVIPTGTPSVVRVDWSTFSFVEDTVFSEYFDEELISFQYAQPVYLKVEFYCTYLAPEGNRLRVQTRTLTTTELTQQPSISYLVRSFLDNFISYETTVYNLSATVTPLDTPDGSPSTTSRLSRITIDAPYVNEDTDPATLFSTTFKIPDPVEPSGLFEWLSRALRGVLSTPLVPIGDYSITIGSVVGMLLGLSLVMAFLKFFAGG